MNKGPAIVKDQGERCVLEIVLDQPLKVRGQDGFELSLTLLTSQRRSADIKVRM